MTLSGNVVWKLLLAGVTVCKSQLIGRLSTSQRRGLFVFRRRTCLKFRFGSSSAIAELSLCFSKIVATNSHNCVLQNSFASPRICTPERPRVVLAHTPSPFVCSFLAFIQTGWLIDYTNALLLNTGCTMPAPPPSSGHVAFGPLALPRRDPRDPRDPRPRVHSSLFLSV